MDKREKGVYAKSFKEQLTLRGIILGVIGSTVITTSSMYVALRMGALPWPTLFVAIMSMTLLKALKNTNLNEINVTHTIMSAGAMVAGGFAFTIPGIWMLDKTANISFTTLLVVTLSGTILGIICTALIRTFFIEKEALPFPMGIAAYETVIAGDEGGSKSKVLFSTLAGSAVFTALRDWFGLIPGAINVTSLAAKNIFVGVWISPMAIGIGYIIGPIFTGVMFLGALISYLLIIPVGISTGIFADVATATAFKDSLGIGLMVGTGIGVLLKGILPRAKELYGPMLTGKAVQDKEINIKIIPIGFTLVVFLLTVFTEMGFFASILVIIGAWLTTAMAASMTGQSGINPMEIFAIIVLLVVKALTSIGIIEAFLVAGVIAVACGLAGDVLNDFKSGYLLKTNPKAQLIGETIGAIIGAVVSVVVLFIMMKAYGPMGPGTELVAPQAYAVSTMVGGLPNTQAFIIGLILGIVLYILKVPSTLGLGIYLPMMITSAVAIGGLASYIVSKVKPTANERGTIISSGLLGGEGVTGVLIAIIKVITMS
ncbi:OPT/YSL family transporter [Romboutsia sp.]|uniref:OPT/YSL family transporter n=1 Tax=Romboutsia sp. TaxID=1965302 RepID=UPI003F2AF69F